ncbi:MAG: putative entry exclusion protein TrbK-alt [Rhizobiales bacterium]|nr:putative entry exclusion protein TrbK-alt [Hyphomicrobiales bacterium]
MDLKIAARMIAVIAIGAGLTAAFSALRDDDAPDATAPGIARPGGEPDRRSELSRCRALGAAALEDSACRKAWAENRRRFLETDKPARPTTPKPQRFGKQPGLSGASDEERDTKKEQERLLPDGVDKTEEVKPHG